MGIPESSEDSSLKDTYTLFLENVVYKNFDEQITKNDIEVYRNFVFGLMKDTIYSYEQEIRIVIRDRDTNSSSETLSLPFDKELLKFFTLVFHPKANHWYCATIRNLLKELKIPIECQQSSLKYR